MTIKMPAILNAWNSFLKIKVKNWAEFGELGIKYKRKDQWKIDKRVEQLQSLN